MYIMQAEPLPEIPWHFLNRGCCKLSEVSLGNSLDFICKTKTETTSVVIGRPSVLEQSSKY